MKPNQLQVLEMKNQLLQKFRGFALLGRETPPANLSTVRLNLKQTEQWLKRADIVGSNVNHDEFTALFNKFESPNITMDDFMTLVDDISRRSNVPVGELHTKLLEVKVPGPNDVVEEKSSSLSLTLSSSSSTSTTAAEKTSTEKKL